MKRLSLLFGLVSMALLSSVQFAKAQQGEHLNCGHTEAQEKLYREHPELRQKEEDFRAVILDYVNNKMDVNALEKNRAGDYIIPIVFHILHNYGTEDITDAQVYDQVRILNVDYQKKNADTSVVLNLFKSRIGNANLEFRLAKKDPQGNCTNGIDRINTYKTNFADDQSKLNQWPQQYYLNVWVTKSIGSAGVAGYAYKPISVGNIWFWDGIIILHDYIGSIGTGNVAYSRALTHEIGHYLGLDHPWGSTNNPEVACGDDGVEDTPKTKGTTSCNLNSTVNDCDTIQANIQNYMDYSYCSVMFTKGQVDYMRQVLNSSLYRKLLYSAQAGTATGVTLPYVDCKPVVDFNVTSGRVFTCVGNSVQLKDYSRDSITGRNWSIANTTIADPTLSTITPTFNAPGWTDVTLTATAASGSSTLTRNNYLYVSDGVSALNDVQRFENASDLDRWPIFNYFNNDFKWERTNRAALFSSYSLMYKNYDNRMFPESVRGSSDNDWDDIYTPPYDLTSFAGSTCNLNFWTSAASRKTAIFSNKDSFVVYYSTNCGGTWLKLKSYKTSELFNKVFTNDYIPQTLSDWSARTLAIPAAALTANTYFRFRYYPTANGNNFYIDDIGVSKWATEVVASERLQDNFLVYPNPTLDGRPTIALNVNDDAAYQLVVTDMVGRVLHTVPSTQINRTNNQYTLPAGVLSTKGIYFVSLVKDGSQRATQKFIYQ